MFQRSHDVSTHRLEYGCLYDHLHVSLHGAGVGGDLLEALQRLDAALVATSSEVRHLAEACLRLLPLGAFHHLLGEELVDEIADGQRHRRWRHRVRDLVDGDHTLLQVL